MEAISGFTKATREFGIDCLIAVDKRTLYREVATLHAANIDRGFLATLGVPFLALMYQAIDESEQAVLLTEVRDGRIVGFVSGSKGMRQIYLRMLRRPHRLSAALAASVIRPKKFRRILEIVRYGRGSSTYQRGVPEPELLSIAVTPEARGQGVAESLYRRLMSHFLAAGERACRIVVGDTLLPAHKFYKRMGATPVGHVEVHKGEGSVIYIHYLD